MSGRPLILGVVGTSTKENEFRLPIHPAHMPRLDPALRSRIFFEEGYGARFGLEASDLGAYSAGTRRREELFASSDVILLPKPTEKDYPLFREGQVLWGWPHCVQGTAITQVGIDKRMTFIAWEAMHSWRETGVPELHTFSRNNELAGYCSVLHSFRLQGVTGHYGAPRQAAILSFGSTARGAVHALRGLGITDISVYTQRPAYAVQNRMPSVRYYQMRQVDPEGSGVVVLRTGRGPQPMAQALAGYEIIVNCVLQDTERPLMFIAGEEVGVLRPGTLIVDVSCDAGMGFDFARPTSFELPTFEVGRGVTYYAVDHSPSYLWAAATWEISNALMPHISTVMGGREAWRENPTIHRAIEILDGRILNRKILRFQNRAAEYPHPIAGPA